MSTARHCRPEAYRLFVEQLPTLETTAGLVRAAVAVAAHELAEVNVAEVEHRLEEFAQAARSGLRSNSTEAALAHLHEALFELEQFRGDMEDYYNPQNSYLPVVLERRRGLPITLALVYKAVAERVGLDVAGVNSPGHFLAAVAVNGSRMLVDPFAGGRVLTLEEAREQLLESGASSVVPVDALFPAATHANWIGHMLNNLAAIFARSGRAQDLAAMQELMLALRAAAA